MKIVKEIPVEPSFIDYAQKLFYEYESRKDIINSIFELHKYDADSQVLKSAPFEHYEKLFTEAKVAYDTMMEETKNAYVPEEYRKEEFNFEISFDNQTIRIQSHA